MSQVGIDAIGLTNSVLSKQTQNILGKDDFLTLLVTQLQNQDPLNPQDSTEFTAQLAQFSSLEQLGNINDNLEYLKLALDASSNSQAVALIGKQITAEGNAIQLDSDGAGPCHFELTADTRAVSINIYDASGNFVTTFEAGALNAGEHQTLWDGKDFDGHPVPDGIYFFEVLAVDADDHMVDAISLTGGTVTGVSFRDNTPYLVVGNQEIAIGDVIRVSTADIES